MQLASENFIVVCRYILPDLEATTFRGINISLAWRELRIMCRCEFAPSRKIRRTKVMRIFTNSGGRNKSDTPNLA